MAEKPKPLNFALPIEALPSDHPERGVHAAQILVSSMVSARDLSPWVTLHWGEMAGQLDPQEAREHAFRILQCADAAEGDAFICDYMVKNAGVPPDHVGAVLCDFRKWREENAKEQSGEPDSGRSCPR